MEFRTELRRRASTVALNPLAPGGALPSAVEERVPAPARLTEIRCAGCGYGGVVARLPQRCPMCGGTVWHGRSSRTAWV